MKNSAWYQKLWLKKLDKLPVKDADLGWEGMRTLLDEQMPVSGNPAGRPAYSSAAKLIKTIIGYILPVVVITAISLYYTLPAFNHSKTDKADKRHISDIDIMKKAGKRDTNSFSRQNNITVDSTNAASPINSADKSSRLENTGKVSPKVIVGLKNVIATDQSKNKIAVAAIHNNRTSINKPAEENDIGKTTVEHHVSNGIGTGFTIKNESQRHKQLSQSHRKQGANSSVADQHAPPTGNLNRNKYAVIKNSGNSSYSITNKTAPTQDISKDSVSKVQFASVLNRIKDVNPVVAGSATANNNGQPGKISVSNIAAAQKDAPGNTNKGSATTPAKAKTANNSPVKNQRKNKIITPNYNYGLETGLSTAAANSTSFYFGGFGSYAIKPRSLFNIGIRINSNRTISGRFTHISYHGQDSIPPFAIADTRKLLVADIPVTVEYKLFNALSIKAGALFILPIKQSGINTKLAPIAYPRDTLYHTQEINTALNNTTMNKVNLGFTGGISAHIKKFDINFNYQVLKPYKISDALGSYTKTYQTFQLGVGWRFR
jgi:hypothetical protein